MKFNQNKLNELKQKLINSLKNDMYEVGEIRLEFYRTFFFLLIKHLK